LKNGAKGDPKKVISVLRGPSKNQKKRAFAGKIGRGKIFDLVSSREKTSLSGTGTAKTFGLKMRKPEGGPYLKNGLRRI